MENNTKYAIQHGFIAPTSYLHLIPEDCTFHLLLAHLLKDPMYSAFYRKRKQAGDFIIIDNGAFEMGKPLDVDEYYRLVSESGVVPDVVVAPDYPKCAWEKTVESTIKFVKEYGKYFDTTKTDIMAVPQSEIGDYKGWIKAYSEFSLIDEVSFIGMSILGIPNAFRSLTGTGTISFNRIFASLYLKNNRIINMDKKHHYLGCDEPRELLMQKEIGIAYSNDSSSAFWHAIHGIKFDSSSGSLINGKIKIPVDFDHTYNDEYNDDIMYNVNYILNMLKIE